MVKREEINRLHNLFSSLSIDKKLNIIFGVVSSELVAKLDNASSLMAMLEDEKKR